MRRFLLVVLSMLALLVVTSPAAAQAATEPAAATVELPEGYDAGLLGADEAPDATVSGGMRMSTAIEIAVVLTVLSLVPAVLVSLTCFTRIIIVLSFIRRSMGTPELPPNPILIGLSLFMTTFVMAPVFTRMYERSYVPYRSGQMEMADAGQEAWSELRGFLVANTRPSELELFAEMSHLDPRDDGGRLAVDDLPFQVVVPAFVLSELKTAFQMGFLLFLPFLVIDLVVASVLISMGMFMLPPVMISTPFKILLFVLVDGWHLVVESLATSFLT